MTPRVTGTRVRTARTVWRHYFFQACASFALYQVDCPAAGKRAARAGSRGDFNARIGGCLTVRTKLRTGGVWPFLHTAKSVSQRRVRSMRSHGTADRVGNQDGRAAPCPWALPWLLSLYSRGHNKASDQDPGAICRYGQATGQPSSQATCAKPLRESSGMTYSISRGGRG